MDIDKWIPGIEVIRNYQREWLRKDIFAGLSVASVALPIGIAYAQLIGFNPVIGIYSCILPAVAYSFFGTSKQLVVNPDAAACIILASTLAPMAAGNLDHYLELSIALSFLTGLLCIIGGFINFGVIADFLSKPILTGYLNGIALSIIASQLGTLLGFKIPPSGIFRTIYHAVTHVDQLNEINFLFGLLLFLLLLLFIKFLPKIPYSLVIIIIAGSTVYLLNLDRFGVEIIEAIPTGFLSPKIPSITTEELWPLLSSALGIVLVSFCSMMTTARSFASKGGYMIDANKDLIALGISDIASGLTRGFVVSGADSRTAVAATSGGKTQVASITAALAMTIVLLYFTKPLAYVPKVALAVTLIVASLSLFDFKSLIEYRRVDKIEFRLSLLATLGVMTIGVLPGVLVAVAMTIFQLLRLGSRPHDAVLGLVKGKVHVFDCIDEEEVEPIKNLLIYRFDASLLFFNADHFRQRIREEVKKEKPLWVLLDAESAALLDITAVHMIVDLNEELNKQGITFAISRPPILFNIILQKSGLIDKIGEDRIFPTIHAGVNAFHRDQEEKKSK